MEDKEYKKSNEVLFINDNQLQKMIDEGYCIVEDFEGKLYKFNELFEYQNIIVS